MTNQLLPKSPLPLHFTGQKITIKNITRSVLSDIRRISRDQAENNIWKTYGELSRNKNVLDLMNGNIPKLLHYSYIHGNMEYIDRVDVRHSESASGVTGSDTVTALQRKSNQPRATIWEYSPIITLYRKEEG